MAKKSIRHIKRIIKLEERLKSIRQTVAVEPERNIDIKDMLSSLLTVDTMLCMSASVATHQYAENAGQLLAIIQKHHIGLEVFLSNNGIIISRSKAGDEFNPEYMKAHPQLIDTCDAALHGKVANSVTPRFEQKGTDGKPDILLQEECVMLYNFK
ncbi:MAG: hypothetical protein IKV23_08435 [Bacteroidaceae bacterium]|nr:hypothetical protein [Bacteroidaceae bacterium]